MIRGRFAILPILFGFFIMGFANLISTAMIRIKAECGLPDLVAGAMPMAIFVWFLIVSLPTGILCGRIGRKNTVLIALGVTVCAMPLPFFASSSVWLYVVALSMIGIGNTILQVSLPALLSNVVDPSQLASRISLGQFFKAVCCAVTPVVAFAAAKWLGNWKYMFVLYGFVGFVAGAWLLLCDMPREAACGSRTSVGSCLSMLRNPYVLAMTVGIVFSVGADIGFAVAIPEYLKVVFKVDIDRAATGPTIYFVAKTIAAFAGSVVFARISAAKCLPWSIGMSILAVVLMFFASTPGVFLVLVFVAALGFANTFGMCMGLAIDREPEKANEISALMVMAIVGGGLITFAMGAAQSAFGATGITALLLMCLSYLLGLGTFASLKSQGIHGGGNGK